MIAKTSPMGWNSWDCYGASVDEATVRKNAEYMAKYLKEYGWEYVCVDIQWYEPTADSHFYHDFADVCVDEYARLIPAENRFPSSAGGKGFADLAAYVHSLGLKFGIHIMRGIPRKAVHAKMKIKGSDKTADQIAGTSVKHEGANLQIVDACTWNTDMYGVNPAKEGARAYYASIFELYASWGVDFIKCDDLCREIPHHEDEFRLISECIKNCGREMVFSASPGPALLEKAEFYKQNCNMWRITGDFWDEWKALYKMFARAEKWSAHAGAGHWPDADMLPFGAIRQCDSKDNRTRFTKDEQYTVMTLWSIIRSPLIMGGDLPSNDAFTLSLLTNRDVLDMHLYARNTHQVFRREINGQEHAVFIASSANGGFYLTVFNLSDGESDIEIPLSEFEVDGKISGKELWTDEKADFDGFAGMKINAHGCKAYYFEAQTR